MVPAIRNCTATFGWKAAAGASANHDQRDDQATDGGYQQPHQPSGRLALSPLGVGHERGYSTHGLHTALRHRADDVTRASVNALRDPDIEAAERKAEARRTGRRS